MATNYLSGGQELVSCGHELLIGGQNLLSLSAFRHVYIVLVLYIMYINVHIIFCVCMCVYVCSFVYSECIHKIIAMADNKVQNVSLNSMYICAFGEKDSLPSACIWDPTRPPIGPQLQAQGNKSYCPRGMYVVDFIVVWLTDHQLYMD